ncbi:hypothetical protein [Streptomyces sp. NPDC058964]|uniref:hypothetical protein n=1 Tax=Streptomyces sp. NPDC058964 TaxID=3346681 RepID=UPI0036C977A0
MGAVGASSWAPCGRAEYERRDPDPGLDRLVQPVLVDEPSAAEVRDILRGVRGRLEAHHDAVLTDRALEAAGALARDRVPDHSLPGSAVDLLDEAAALARTRAARSDPPADAPVRVTEAEVTQALAARSGIRASVPLRTTTPQAGPLAQHDPSIWSLS